MRAITTREQHKIEQIDDWWKINVSSSPRTDKAIGQIGNHNENEREAVVRA